MTPRLMLLPLAFALVATVTFGCRSEIDQLGGTSVLRFDNVIWN